MTKKGIGILLAGLIAVVAAAATGDRKPTDLVCSLTGKTIKECCCVVQKDGSLYCTLAERVIDSCCCKPATEKPSQEK